MGYAGGYGLLNPGTFGVTLGMNNAWGAVGLTIGGTGDLSSWDFHWSTVAGGGGIYPNRPLPSTNYSFSLSEYPDSRFFHGSYYEASRLLVYESKHANIEMNMYYTSKGYYYDQTEGYVFSDQKIDNERYRYFGKRFNGTYIYNVSNSIDAATLYRISAKKDKDNYKPFLDLGLNEQYEVLKMYHTHPRNTFLSPDDPFQDIIQKYAIGWDGIRRGAPLKNGDAYMIEESTITAPRIIK